MTGKRLDTYGGELSDTMKTLWRLSRRTHDRSPLYRLRAPPGLIVWGDPPWAGLMMIGIAAAFALTALGLGKWRYDPSLWPLWLGTAIGVVTTLCVFARVERFTLDTFRRRWIYRRGWRWNPGEESGGFDQLKGFVLHVSRLSVLQPKPIYGATLEFADGYRYFHAVLATSSLDAARRAARDLARACDLPLAEDGVEPQEPA